MKTCVTCRYHRVQVASDGGLIATDYLCDNPDIFRTNPVTGTREVLTCHTARLIEDCGPDALLWEELPIPSEHRVSWAKSCGYPHEVYENS